MIIGSEAVDRAGLGQKAAPATASGSDDALRETAKQFEVMFIAEMLKSAKVGEAKGPFTGGHGEEAFRSFLVREYAQSVSDQGSFGLADTIYRQLKEKVAADV